MKRFFYGMCVYFIFLCIPIEAKEETLKYKIYTSSNHESLKESKEEIRKRLDSLLLDVDTQSYNVLLKENLSLFELEESVEVKLKGNILYIIYGDGKGEMLSASYLKENICYEEVKPKSLLQEWLSKE